MARKPSGGGNQGSSSNQGNRGSEKTDQVERQQGGLHKTGGGGQRAKNSDPGTRPTENKVKPSDN